MPFLPGDSLLFVAGAIAAVGGMELGWVMLLLTIAAVLGDAVNYSVGHWFGPKVFGWENSRFFNRAAFDRTHAFYEKHGGNLIAVEEVSEDQVHKYGIVAVGERDEVAEAVDAVTAAIESAERVVALRAEKGKSLSNVATSSLDGLKSAVSRLDALLNTKEADDDSSVDDDENTQLAMLAVEMEL